MAVQDFSAMKQDFFNKKRQEASQQVGAATQESSDALTRRFAALGSQGSGAAIGAQLKAKEIGESQRQKAVSDVNAQELQTNMSEAEAQKGRDFQTAEGDKARQTQIDEAARGRDFQGGLAAKDLAMKQDVFGFEKESKLKELDFAKKQMDLDAATTEFNKNLALHIQGIKGFGDNTTKLEQENKAYQETLSRLRNDYVGNQSAGAGDKGGIQSAISVLTQDPFSGMRTVNPNTPFENLSEDQKSKVMNYYNRVKSAQPQGGFGGGSSSF